MGDEGETSNVAEYSRCTFEGIFEFSNFAKNADKIENKIWMILSVLCAHTSVSL